MQRLIEQLEQRLCLSAPSILPAPTDPSTFIFYDGRAKAGDQIVGYRTLTPNADGFLLPVDVIDCGSKAQRLTVKHLPDKPLSMSYLVNDATGVVIDQWDKDSSQYLIINGGNGADQVTIDGGDIANGPADLGLWQVVFNGQNGADTMVVEGQAVQGTFVFNGDDGKDTFICDQAGDYTVFNGGNGNDTAVGSVDVVNIGGKT